jgi:ATP-dependent protease ClpP protease subunit
VTDLTESLDVSDADFTPNPDRAIWVEGQLNEALMDRLRPRILDLTAQNREPITVFINSRGGSSEVGEGILSLLRRTTQNDARASRIITVAAPKAKSAAANLLSAGDWAMASPESTLLYHGARWPLPVQDLTGEWARIGRVLPTFHETAAVVLAQHSARRFQFIVRTLRGICADHRTEVNDSTLTDLNCFAAILCGKLSPAAQKVLKLAIPLCESYNGLFLNFRKRLRRGRDVTTAHLQKLMLYASMDFECESSRRNPAWDGGLSAISDHFYFLNTYFRDETNEFGKLREWVAARAEPHKADAADVEAVQFQMFLLALCRALQEGENELTPADAVWLGLIDTVRDDFTAARI